MHCIQKEIFINHEKEEEMQQNDKQQRRRKQTSPTIPVIPSTPLLLLAFFLLLSSFITTTTNAKSSSSSSSSPSSLLLKMHRLHYNTKTSPPHDTLLYDILKVKSNATAADITSSYRKLSREYHPDKLLAKRRIRERKREEMLKKGGTNENSVGEEEEEEDDDDEAEEEEAERMLTKIREAYEVLKDDSTRLLYHRFGLIDDSTGVTALALLSGGDYHDKQKGGEKMMVSEERRKRQQRLLELMGYGNMEYSGDGRHQQRVMYIAANLVERIRPIVEGTITQDQLSHDIASECNALKSLPLGSQILRCLGRAYRHSGQRALRRYRKIKRRRETDVIHDGSYGYYKGNKVSMKLDLTQDSVSDKIRNIKHLMTAAMASGKLVWTEQVTSKLSQQQQQQQQFQKRKNKSTAIEYHDIGTLPGELEDGLLDSDADLEDLSSQNYLPTEEDVKRQEQSKAQQAMIHALQVEALWKISKIELDRTIQEACNLILEGRYFFFPSHQHYQQQQQHYYGGGERRRNDDDGWVVESTGQVVNVNIGRIRAAAALVLMGDIFVRCSKEGTSWVD